LESTSYFIIIIFKISIIYFDIFKVFS